MSNKPIQHGEIVLLPVSKIPAGKTTKHKSFIVAHSESGHHHVLESEIEFEVTETEKQQLYFRLFKPAKLVHKKAVDFHPTLPVTARMYKSYSKTEFDLWEDIIRDVKD